MKLFVHYLIRAFRNLVKYKTQTVISIIGLAVGFTCFSLSALWIRHELSFDTFHDNADQLYQVRYRIPRAPSGYEDHCPDLLGSYLVNHYPEIEAATRLYTTSSFYLNQQYPECPGLRIDSGFFSVFHLRNLGGNTSKLADVEHIIITDKLQQQLWGGQQMVGQAVPGNEVLTIQGMCEAWPLTNLPFDCIQLADPGYWYNSWNVRFVKTYVRLRPGTDVKKLNEKLMNDPQPEVGKNNIHEEHIVLFPLSKVHYDHPTVLPKIKFEHIVVFALSGLLVILCSLFNFLTLFVSRIHLRSKELALYKVSGASSLHIFGLLGCEFIFTLILAMGVGYILIEWSMPTFLSLSEIKAPQTNILAESGLFSLGVIVLTLFVTAFPLFAIQRRTLQQYLLGGTSRNGKNSFRKISIVCQLMISIVFIFCTIVLIKQMYHLQHTNIGFDRTRVCRIQQSIKTEGLHPIVSELKKIPSITEILEEKSIFLPSASNTTYTMNSWEDKNANDQSVLRIENFSVSPSFFDFYRTHLLEGNGLSATSTPQEVVINEAARKRLGWTQAIGKRIGGWTVVGVIKDLHTGTFSQQPLPIAYSIGTNNYSNYISYRYAEQTRQQTEDAVRNLIAKIYPDYVMIPAPLFDAENVEFSYLEEKYDEMTHSEQSLRTLLLILSGVCILISAFGTYSLATLMTEQRRKEIAIRKINGATPALIIRLFLSEYIMLTLFAALIALPAGYLLMRPWIEQFVLQTPINWWIYVLILLLVAVVVSGTVFSKIWKAVRINPAQVIKSE